MWSGWIPMFFVFSTKERQKALIHCFTSQMPMTPEVKIQTQIPISRLGDLSHHLQALREHIIRKLSRELEPRKWAPYYASRHIITRLDIHQNLIFNENLKESQRFRLRCHTRTPITMWICTAFLLTTWFPLFPSSKRSKALHLKAGDCPLQARIILLHGDIRESLNQ